MSSFSNVGRDGRSAGSATAARPDKVLHAFNTWAFKRQQPTEPEMLLATVTNAVTAGEPVHFVLYWGKGPRADIAEPDITCLDFLGKMVQRVEEAYAPGAAVTLVFTDTHATLNGHSPAAIQRYYGAVAEAAAERGFGFEYLSRIVAAARGRLEETPDVPSVTVLAKLKACATKWYRGKDSAQEGALKYFTMNMAERQAIGFAYPKAIFVTFNGAEYRELFPVNMPVFYMYSLRKGIAVKPWFVEVPNPAHEGERLAAAASFSP